MPTYRSGEVTEVLEVHDGLQRVRVRLDGDAHDARAYVVTALVPAVAVGERVVCNTTAVDLGLGTGGWHVVHWSLERDAWAAPGAGHIMKVRYTSLQHDAGSAEEHHPDLPSALDGTPVVACTVHSQVAAVAVAVAHERPGTRLAYVMTDGAALPLALSDLVRSLRERHLLCGTVTAGHAFGGDHEAVDVPSALLVARHLLDAEVVVVGMGPGVVGTGTPFGTTAVEAGGVLAAAAGLGGEAILAVRASEGDPRPRHAGVSHHVDAILGTCFAPAALPLVPRLPDADVARLSALLRPGQRAVPVAAPDVAGLLASHDLPVTTMGRSVAEDLLFFESAAAAGALAASRCT